MPSDQPQKAQNKQSKESVIRENVVIPLWSVTVWLVVMNTTMFNVALPEVTKQLTLSESAASWIVTGYSIVFAIATITYSRLSDFISIRRLLTIGLSILAVASLLGFFSQNFFWLLASRLLQAGGAAAVPGLGMVLATRYIPLSRRGKSMSMISSGASLGFGLGPVIGGAATQVLGWNFLFIITGFVTLLIPYFRKMLPSETDAKVKFDALGGAAVGLAVTCLLLFLTTFSYLFLLISLVAAVFGWRHVHRVDVPFIQPVLLRNSSYLMILFMGFSAFVTHFAALFLMPMMLHELFGKPPAVIGLIIFPGAMLSAVAAIFIGRMIDRFGNAVLVRWGHLLILLSTILFSSLAGVSSYAILLTYMFMSVGFSALTSSLANEISRILPKTQIGTGIGMAQLIQFFGGAFGVSIAGVLMVWLNKLAPAVMYRSIFAGLACLILVSFLFLNMYLKKKSLAEPLREASEN